MWSRSQDVAAYTSLANLCLTPAFLAKLTDTDTTIYTLLRFRAYDLFGYWPDDSEASKPSDYDRLTWADPLPAVRNLERSLRAAMRTKPRDRVVVCARTLGWLFSDFQPDATL